MIKAKEEKKVVQKADKPKKTVPKVVKPKPQPVVKIPMSIVHKTCGLVDPFCTHAKGAKYPDSSSAKTLSYTIRYSEVASTDVNGRLIRLVLPHPNIYNFLQPNGVIAADGSAPYTNTAAPALALLSGTSSFRIVSTGYRAKFIGPPQTCSGTIHFRTFTAQDGLSLAVVSGMTYAASEVYDSALIDCKDVSVISPHTSQMPQNFYPIGAPAGISTWTSTGFAPSSILVMGGQPSTPVLYLEYLMHVEYTFGEGDALSLATQAPPPPNPVITAAAAVATSVGTTIYHKTVEVASEFAKRVVIQAVSKLIGARLGPVAGAGSNMLMNGALEVD